MREAQPGPQKPANPGAKPIRAEVSRFELAFLTSTAPMIISDLATGAYLEVNDAWLRCTGYAREEMLGRTSMELGILDHEDRERLHGKLREHGRLQDEPVEVHTREGALSCLLGVEIIQEAGDLRVLSTLQDITQLKAQTGRLERLTQLYASLSQVNQAIVRSATREALLDRICEVMVEFGRFSMAWIGWDDPATHEVRAVSRYGDRFGYLQGLQVRSDDTPLGRGGTGTAIRTGLPFVINDLQASAPSTPWHDKAVAAGFAASGSFPIHLDGAAVGALVVYAPVKGYFGPNERVLLEEAARHLSFALAHLELEARKQEAEAALRLSEAQFRLLFDRAPVGMAIVNSATGRFLSVNPRLGEILGYAPGELRERTFQELTHPDHLEQDLASVRDLAMGLVPEVRKEKRYVHRSGKILWVRLTMVRIPPAPGEPLRHLSIIEDITEAHEGRVALEEALGRLQKIADRVPGVVYQYRRRPDGSAHMPFASEAIRRIYGLSPDEVRQDVTRLNTVHHPDDHEGIMASIQASALSLSPWRHEFRLKFPDGTIRLLYGDAVPEREADGSILWTGFITDITERRQMENQLLQAQKMESIGSLAGGVAHDMNNVLAAILALSSVQLYQLPRHDPAYQTFETIREAATRGGNVVKGLLKFARQRPKERRPVDLNELIQEEARLLEHTTLSRVRLELDLDPGLRPVVGDAGELSHAFMNLCINAVDAMEAGGTLSLRTRNAGPDRVEVTVSDTGSGMSPEVLKQAMDPFFTTKEVGKGTGLGLAMVYATMRAHEGQVELHSEPGRGTRARLIFPAGAALSSGPETRASAAGEAPMPALAILLVDDDELVLKATRTLVASLGHAATPAESGERALELIAGGFRPDLIILDMNMPGLGGKGTLPLLRRQCPGVPILLVTGRADQEALDLAGAHPRVTLLAKPFSLAELASYLRSQAGRASVPEAGDPCPPTS